MHKILVFRLEFLWFFAFHRIYVDDMNVKLLVWGAEPLWKECCLIGWHSGLRLAYGQQRKYLEHDENIWSAMASPKFWENVIYQYTDAMVV